jgi:hypothetical protein
MKSAVACLFLLLCIPITARAAFTDFEDLVDNTVYPVGSTIQSKGLAFDVIPFPNSTGFFSVTYIDQFGPLETIQRPKGHA